MATENLKIVLGDAVEDLTNNVNLQIDLSFLFVN